MSKFYYYRVYKITAGKWQFCDILGNRSVMEKSGNLCRLVIRMNNLVYLCLVNK